MSENQVMVIALAALAGVAVLVVLLLLGSRRRRAARADSRAKTAATPAPAASPEQPRPGTPTSTKPASAIPASRLATSRGKPVTEKPAPATAMPGAPSAAPPARSGSSSPTNKIRILIVDDNRDTRENVSRLLAFEDDMEVIGQAYNGISGLEMARQYQPHIVLMDINMPDMDGITATQEMGVQVPYSQIIIMSVQFETEYMRSAMLAGARDYQTKPFSADELVNCIRRVYEAALPQYQKLEAARRPQAPKEVAIIEQAAAGFNVPIFVAYSPKGGTGTSVIAINFAAALERKHHGVTLLDDDLQTGDLSIHLNLRPTKTLADLSASNRADGEILPDLLLTHSSGLRLLCAPTRPEAAELITGSIMTQTARRLRDHSSAVVIDTASFLSDHNLALMEIAHLVLLVINPDLPSVKNARLFRDLAPELGLPPERITLVINRANIPGAVPAEQIAKALNLPRFFIVPDDPKLRYAAVKGVTIYQMDANAPSAQAIAVMAQALWQLATQPKAQEPEVAVKAK